jgi:hypothetical protein
MRFASLTVLAMCGLAGTAGVAQERGSRVVPERPARVFVMAGFDLQCKSLKPVTITVDRAPEKGTVSLRENQETTIQYSVSGSCIGTRVSGTGIYYTARAGSTGGDTFSVTARLGAETATRTFNVQIADD